MVLSMMGIISPKYLTAKQISEIMQGIFSQWDNSLFQKIFKNIPAKRETENWKIFKRNDNEIGNRSRIIASSEVANFR